MPNSPAADEGILVSVITVVRNGEDLIEETLKSVCKIKSPSIEYIVIDGKSTDRTFAILERFSDCIDKLVSEQDAGIYDAMNKAAAIARGSFLLHINAGDQLLRIPTSELMAAKSDHAITSFPVALSSGKAFRPRSGFLLSLNNTLHHQGNFYRRSLTQKYDLKFRTFSDFDLNQRLSPNILTFPDSAPVAIHSTGGVSHDRQNFHEVYAIVRRNRGHLFVPLTWFYFKVQGLRQRLQCLYRSF